MQYKRILFNTKSYTFNLENRTNENVIRTMYHEYGHYLWYKVLSKEEREEYNLIFLSSDSFITEYSFEGGVKEDWAETYEEYLSGSEEISKSRLIFINKMKLKYDQF